MAAVIVFVVGWLVCTASNRGPELRIGWLITAAVAAAVQLLWDRLRAHYGLKRAAWHCECGAWVPKQLRWCPSCERMQEEGVRRRPIGRGGKAPVVVLAIVALVVLNTCMVLTFGAPQGTGLFPSSTRAGSGQAATAAPTQAPEPMSVSNGTVIVETDYKQVCPFTVKASGDCNYYIYLKYLGKPSSSRNSRHRRSGASKPYCEDLAFIVLAGREVSIKVPIGAYELYYACGEEFYGRDLKFGSSTTYFRAEETFEFYTTKKYYEGHTVTLYKVADGNLETRPIPEGMFPDQDM